ncbi:single-stranded-DNA-specific exonuclease RecJ [Culicoidibacter larvae]|uniref:Single-stranded-DNA-specific exonuclease RecJ n=1 Tax=Culicoidibacter larvae TaxID=2579976 RepID=A0A5R8QDH5_9FIRM|nr:single-stranded-DNA-specific exonuclease RecJ [Culicoidibacter larvae]TLG74340.1 single-stranded-DNA-specific exonuclease RecJ [Culicoidibacter larvae]
MLESRMKWQMPDEEINEEVRKIAKKWKLPEWVANLISGRGYHSEAEIQQFLHPSIDQLHDPTLFDVMSDVKQSIALAIEAGAHIRIVGDYDADGICSTTILYMAIDELGGFVDYVIPNRFVDGYGMNTAIVEAAHNEQVDMLITVDNGIGALDAVALAKSYGMQVIVTDHHTIGEQLPAADFILHPELGNYPFKPLCGAGVALKLAQSLLELPEPCTSMLALAAIATVADIMPLVDENRAIVTLGMAALQAGTIPAVKMLMKIAGASSVDSQTLGFIIGPRLNALGRIEDAAPAVDFMLSQDNDELQQFAEHMEAINTERKSIQTKIHNQALAQITADTYFDEQSFIVLYQSDWHEGILGIVASKLMHEFGKPVVLLCDSEEPGIIKGSARSFDTISIYDSFSAASDLLEKFGGHTNAGGLSLKKENLPLFIERLNLFFIEQDYPRQQELRIDVVGNISDFTPDTISMLSLLEPFGNGNEQPIVALLNQKVKSMSQIGQQKDHLKIMLTGNKEQLDVVGFGFGHYLSKISPNSLIDVVGTIGINEWNQSRRAQLMLKDIRIEDIQVFDFRSKKNNGVNRKDWSKDALEIADYPESIDELRARIDASQASNFYITVTDQDDSFFDAQFEHKIFKQSYAIIYHIKSFSLDDREVLKIFEQHRINSSMLTVILQVFFELEFVIIKDRDVFYNENNQKRQLSESPAYNMFIEQRKVKELLSYSPAGDLYQFIKTIKKEVK